MAITLLKKGSTPKQLKFTEPGELGDAAGILGEIRMFAGAAPSAKWHACDGAALSKTEYATLYAYLGDAWGSYSTTFLLPDLQNYFPACAGPVLVGGVIDHKSLAGRGGADRVLIAQANLPSIAANVTPLSDGAQGVILGAGNNIKYGGGQRITTSSPWVALNFFIFIGEAE